MKTFVLEGKVREGLGKKATRELRKEGFIPAVLNGGAIVNLPYEGTLANGEKLVEIENGRAIIVTDFAVSPEAIRKLVYTPDIFIIELTIGGKNVKAVLKDIQFHPVKDTILHMDLLEVNEKKPTH